MGLDGERLSTRGVSVGRGSDSSCLHVLSTGTSLVPRKGALVAPRRQLCGEGRKDPRRRSPRERNETKSSASQTAECHLKTKSRIYVCPSKTKRVDESFFCSFYTLPPREHCIYNMVLSHSWSQCPH